MLSCRKHWVCVTSPYAWVECKTQWALYVGIPHPVVHFLYLLLWFSTLLGFLLLFIRKEQGSMSQEQGKTCDHSAITLLHPAQNFLLLAPLHNCVFDSQGDLANLLERRGRLDPTTAVNFALDIARYVFVYLQTILLWISRGYMWTCSEKNMFSS